MMNVTSFQRCVPECAREHLAHNVRMTTPSSVHRLPPLLPSILNTVSPEPAILFIRTRTDTADPRSPHTEHCQMN